MLRDTVEKNDVNVRWDVKMSYENSFQQRWERGTDKKHMYLT